MPVRFVLPYFWYDLARWLVNGGMFRRQIARALDTGPEDRVLDVGCGTGVYSTVVAGPYLGIDPSRSKIAYASAFRAGPGRRYLVGSLEDVEDQLQQDPPTTALVANVLHHLPDAGCRDLLARLARLVRGRTVVVDPPIDLASPWQRLLLRLDSGNSMRTEEQLLALVSESFELRRLTRFASRSRSVVLSVLECEPRQRARE